MSGYDEALLKRARALHDAPNVTMDGHNDLPWALHDAYDHRLAKFDLREPQGHIKPAPPVPAPIPAPGRAA